MDTRYLLIPFDDISVFVTGMGNSQIVFWEHETAFIYKNAAIKRFAIPLLFYHEHREAAKPFRFGKELNTQIGEVWKKING